ncbi:MAG: arginine--tRNA ligase, partial [Gemmatimonadota bacterium]|nr:arginine--tRNA ligase [Gemmatimonadota bacterium]
MSDLIRAELARVAAALGADGAAFVLERPRDTGHGDLSTNLAMALAKPLRASPRKLAEQVVGMLAIPTDVVSRIEIAGPGFINFWLAEDALASLLARIIVAGPAYGRDDFGSGHRINVEFVSANPTGPLHVGHGRGAAIGDAIAALLEQTGHEVTREFYLNDAGVQIERVIESLWARIRQELGRSAEIPEGGYHGLYLVELAKELLQEQPDLARATDAEGLRRCRIAPARIRQEQEDLLAELRIHYDVWTSEGAVREAGGVEKALALLAGRGLTYEQDGALFLRTSDFGDDKDRVLRKRDGSMTYFLPDIAYHIDKHERGFERAIDLW